MKIATMVYKYPGPDLIGKEGFTYRVVDAYCEEGKVSDLAHALEEGWAESPDEAVDIYQAEQATKSELNPPAPQGSFGGKKKVTSK